MNQNQKRFLNKIHHKVLLNHLEFVMNTINTNSFGILSFERYKSEYNYTLTLIDYFKIKMPKELVERSQECKLKIIEIEHRIYVKNRIKMVGKPLEMSG